MSEQGRGKGKGRERSGRKQRRIGHIESGERDKCKEEEEELVQKEREGREEEIDRERESEEK